MKLTGAQIMMKVLKEESLDIRAVWSSTSLMNLIKPISSISWFARRRVRFMLLTVMPVPAAGWVYAW